MPAPSPANRILTLEIARFIAALCVATEHLSAFSGQYGAGSMPGWLTAPPIAPVLFFFVLSGFVMTEAHYQDAGRLSRLPRYVWRRFCRIYPLYWLSLVPMVWLLWPIYGHKHLYMAEIYSLDPFTPFQFWELNPPAWSLRFEILFYAMFGLALLPRARRYVFGLWLAGLTYQWYSVTFPHAPHPLPDILPPGVKWHMFDGHDWLFFCGIGAALLLARTTLRKDILWLALAVLGGVLLNQIRLENWGFHYPTKPLEPFVGILYAGVIFCLAALERAGALRPPRWTGALGTMSYPLYLLHPACSFLAGYIIVFKLHINHTVPAVLLFGLLITVSLAVTALAAFLLDQPLQRALRRLPV